MAPGSLFHYIESISFTSTCQFLSPFLFIAIFTFQSILQKYQKIFTLLSLLDLTFASDHEGIDNPFIALVARFLIVCAGTRRFACSLLLDWYLGSQKLRGNTYATLLHHPFLFKGKPTQCSRGSKKDFWRHCRGVYAQVKTYQVPITNSYPSHYIICHSPLVFNFMHCT